MELAVKLSFKVVAETERLATIQLISMLTLGHTS